MFPLSLRRFYAREKSSFTLIELLVAMTVLVLMLALLAQMVGLVSSAWKSGSARADNYSQTRVVLGMMERDIQAMVLRSDVSAFYDSQGNPALAFYTRIPGGGNTNRKVSLVEYAVTSSGNPQLLRYDNGGLAYATNATPEIELVPAGTTNLTELPTAPLTTASQSGTYVTSGLDQAQVLVTGVVALQVQFLRPDGTLQSYFHFDYTNPTATTNTLTAVVSIVVLDSASYQLAANANAFSKLSADLGSSPSSTQTYAQYWNAQSAQSTFGTDLPKPVRAGLRVFERRIAIPVPLAIID